MLEKSEALDLVSKRLEQMGPPGDQLVVLNERTMEKPFGWIFFYNSKRFIETRSIMHCIAGNGPVFVNKMTGEIDFFGAVPSLDVILANYQKKLESRG